MSGETIVQNPSTEVSAELDANAESSDVEIEVLPEQTDVVAYESAKKRKQNLLFPLDGPIDRKILWLP